MKSLLIAAALGTSVIATSAFAADYVIDSHGAHASVQFKIKHLGYSWLTGRFNTFDGHFSYDAAKPGQSAIEVNIDPASIDSNHAERDKHLRSADFLDVAQFKQARFVSTQITDHGDGSLTVDGNFTLKGVTRPITIEAHKIGEGTDPWGGYRAGFSGSTEFALKAFGIDYDLGPASANVQIELHVEGIRQ